MLGTTQTLHSLLRKTTIGKSSKNVTLATYLAYTLTYAVPVYASPTGGAVVGGQGSIEYQGANTTINQASGRLAIDWQTFNVAEDESVRFIQPGQDAIALNRILDQNPSQIFGRIDANGNVMLMNARGIIFGRSASINVGGLVASSLDIDPNEFMNSQSYTFSAIEGTEGVVVNQGLINAATGGSVSLIGKSVQNDGIIVANLGKVNLAAGSEAVLTFGREGLMGVEVTKEVLENDIGVDSAVLNSGTIAGEGSQVALTAKVSRDVFSNAVNNTGIIQATSIQERGGSVYLAGVGATVENQGTLDVSATQSGVDGGTVVVTGDNIIHGGAITADAQLGNGGVVELNSQDTTLLIGDSAVSVRSESAVSGTVKVLGDKVGLFDQATIESSGATGGGTVLIGGDERGENPIIKNATATYVGADTRVRADALNNGSGGKIIVYADDSAKVYGEISAAGGAQSGDGGFVETSGKNYLDINVFPDITANSGRAGAWLIDPIDVKIVAGSGSTGINDTSPFSPTVNSAQLGVDLIIQALNGGASVFVDTGSNGTQQGDITLATDLDYNNIGLGGTLTLNAADDIFLDNRIYDSDLDSQDNLNISLNTAGSSGDIRLDFYLGNEIQIETNGGNFTAVASRHFRISTESSINTGLGDITFSVAGNIQLPKLTTQGNLTVRTTGQTGNNGISQLSGLGLGLEIGGTTTLSAGPENISLNNASNDFNSVVVESGNNISLTDSNNIEITSSIDPFTTSGNLIVTAGQDVTLSGSIDIGGDITANAGRNINVAGTITGNNFVDLNLNSGMSAPASSVDLSAATVARNIVVTGNSIDDTLVGFNQDTTWTISSQNAGSFGSSPNRTFSSMESLAGGNANDVFIFQSAGRLTGTLNGGQGSDRAEYNALAGQVAVDLNNVVDIENVIGNNDILVGADVDNTWNITGAGAGNVLNSGDGVTTAFTGFNTVTGGAQQDEFTIDADVGGSISGGEGDDTFTLNSDMSNAVNGDAGNDTFTITVNNSGGVFGGNDDDTFVIIDGITASSIGGGAGTNDVLDMSAYSIDITFNITNNNAGTVTETAAPANTLVTFTGVENANSGGGNDEFVFADGMNLSGGIDGAAGTDTLNYSAYTSALTVDLGSLVNFEVVTGGSASDTLIGTDVDNTWNITSDNSGTAGTVSFSNFENLTGGSGDDDFIFDDAVNISGVLDGGDGTDSADYSAHTADLSLDMENILNIEDLTGGAGTDTLTGQDTPNSWTLTGTASGSVNGTHFTSIENLTGGTDTDNFAPDNGVVFGGIIDGGLGIDTMDYSAFNTALTIDVTNLINIEQVIGGSSSDTLFAGDNANTWTITDLNEGSVNGFNFSGVENLRGGAADDEFIFANNAAEISGTADGQGGANTLDFTGVSSDVTLDRANPANSTNVGSFIGITNVVGGGGANDTLVGLNSDATWQLNGSSSGSTAGFTFSGFENLTGGSGQDNFVFSDAWITTGVINGGANTDALDYSALTGGVTIDLKTLVNFESVIGSGQTDTLIAGNGSNNWNLTAQNEGNVNGFSFTGIENLTGGDLNDTFMFQASSGVSGSIDGGQGTDTLNYSVYGADVALDLQSNTATGTGGITNIEAVNGSAGANDVLTGVNSVNTWTIDGANSGNVNSAFSFSGIETVNGGSLDDIFQITDTGSLSGAVNGGNGNDVVDYSQRTLAVTVDLSVPGATAIGSFSGIEGFIGSQAADTFAAANVNNTWQITADDSGSVAGFTFSGFENLIGGSLDDEFVFADGVVFAGVIDGGAGINTLNYGNFTTGVTIDLSTLFGFSGFVGSNFEDTLIGDNIANNWSLTGNNQGTVNNSNGMFTFSAIENLTGGNTTDTFAFAAGASVDGVIDGGTGNNTLDYSAYGSAVTVDLAQNTATATGNISNITAVTGSAAIDALVAADTSNSWNISSNDSGTLNTFSFSGMEMLTGGMSDDTFIFANTAAVSGIIDGGQGTDTLDYSAYGADVALDLQANTATATGAIANIDSVIGSAGADDVLTGADGINTWTIDGGNSGDINGAFSFSGVETVNGGSLDDTFTITDTGSLSGAINGGNGNDTVDYSQRTLAVAVDLNTTGATGMGAFSGIEGFIGSQAVDTFTAADMDNTWQVTGNDSGSVAGYTFSGFENLVGGSANDAFVFADGVGFSGVINGGAGVNTLDYSNFTSTGVTIDLTTLVSFSNFVGSGLSDTLVGDNLVNNWTLTGNNQGVIDNSSGSFTFSAIENLTGGNTTDTFSFAAGTSVDSVVNGGAGNNTLDYSSYGGGITVDLAQNTASGTGNISNITALTGSAAGDTLIAGNTANTWTISANDSGTLNTFNFTDVETLNGGVADDTFVFANGMGLSGTVNGGGGNGIDTLDYSQYTSAVTVDLGAGSATGTGGISNIESAIGGLAADILVGADVANNWNIAGNNSGTVNSFVFRSFENVRGGAMADTFNVSADAVIGGINGGDGNDTLTVAYGGTGRTISFDGANGDDTVTLTGNASALQSQYIFSDSTPDDLTNTMGNQTVVMQNIEQANDQMSSAGITITASDSDNTIQLAGSAIGGTNPMSVTVGGTSSFVPLNFSNKPNVTINGGDGSDSIDIAANVAVSGALTLDVESINASPFTLSADRLAIRNASAVGNLNQPVMISANELQLTDITGDVHLLETYNGLNVLDSNISGNLQLATTSGDISASGVIAINGDATFIGAHNSSFTLNNANNHLQGEVSFTVADPLSDSLNNVELSNAGALMLGQVDSRNLNVTATGDITESVNARLTVSGTAQFDAAGNNAMLDGAANDLGIVAASNVNEFSVTDVNDIGLAAISASSVIVNAGGQISSTGANISADSAQLNAQNGVGNNAAIQTTVRSLSATNSSSGNINISNAGNLTIASIDNAATSANGGSVTVTGNESITQSGQISAGNNVSLSAGGGYAQQANITATNNVSVTAENGAITMVDGTRTDSAGATITYNSPQTVTISSLDAVFGQGRVEVSSDQGNILSSRTPDLSQPNVTGNYALFDAPFGSLGEPGRPLVINVPGTVVINTFTSVAPIYIALPDTVVDTSRLLFDINEAIAEVGGNQRTEVDALAIIDPAVFTQVKNYSEDLYPVKLPPDQLLSEDEEQKKKEGDPDIFEAAPANQYD